MSHDGKAALSRDGDEFDPLEDAEEQRVVFAAIDSFASYRRAAHYNVTHVRRQSFYALPSEHWTLLAAPPFSILDTLNAVDDAIDANADLAEAIKDCAASALPFTDANQSDNSPVALDSPWKGAATANDRDKARSTLRQLYRDWAAEGAEERAVSYGPVLAALSTEYDSTPLRDKADIKVLVPGAGLGRLPFEVCRLGFSAEGNEISYHQLFASSFVLNHIEDGRQYPLYPFALSFSNHVKREHQLQKVLIPDNHPGTVLQEASADTNVHAFERMSMAAADFCIAYKESQNKDAYDAVLTVFFLDTAPNLIAYIETVRHCLRPGGLWINNGPLLWHFENNAPGQRTDRNDQRGAGSSQSNVTQPALGIAEAGSVELSNEEVIALLKHFGFIIERHEHGDRSTGYIQDPHSMMQHLYKPSFWVARKQSK